MTVKTQLEILDFKENGHIDTDSVHPNKLRELITDGFVQEVDPQDGGVSFFILTEKGWEVLDGE